jgi:hypothetical protein
MLHLQALMTHKHHQKKMSLNKNRLDNTIWIIALSSSPVSYSFLTLLNVWPTNSQD